MINIDSRSSTPIYQQIIDGIKENILRGIIEPGDKLPSIRDMSSIIMANPNTVSKAYGELERQKVIETIRGKGTYVTSEYKPKLEEERMEKLKEDIKKIVVEAYYIGIKKDRVMNMMEIIYKELDNNNLTKNNKE